MVHLVTELQRKTAAQHEELMTEFASLRSDMEEIKQLTSRLKPAKRGPRGLFGRRRRSIPVEVEEHVKPSFSFPELLPLLPQLGKSIPQLNNQKVMEGIKILSNPAIMSMVQQFLNKQKR